MTRAIIYSRFSPRRNADDCQSIETQLTACRAECAKRGLAIVEEFEDREASRSDAKRPGLWAAIAALRRGMVLVVYRRDRLASGYLSAVIGRQVAKQGATIHAVTGGINDDTPEARLANGILDLVAEFEREIIGARTKYAMLRFQGEGRAMSSHAPYGKRRGTDRETVLADGSIKSQRMWEDDPTEQLIIRRICEMNGTPSEIATLLNLKNIPCRGKLWRHDLIAKIIKRQLAVV